MSDVPTLPDKDAAQRHVENTLILSAMTGCVLYSTVYGSMPAMFLFKGLKASPFQVGLLSTLCSLTTMGMLLGTVLVYRLGKVRLLLWGRMAGLAPVTGMLALAACGAPDQPLLTLGALSCCCCLALVMNVGTTSWWPLLQDNVPEATMGGFFARMRIRLRGVEIGLPILMGFWLGKDPSAQRFMLPFGIGAAAMLLGAQVLRRLPERPAIVPDVDMWLRLRLAWRDRNVRSYMLFMAVYFGIVSMSAPFWMVLLTADGKNPYAGLPTGYVQWLSAIAAIGHMLSLRLWAYLVDHHGGRPASSLCIVLGALAGLAWLALPHGGGWLLYVWATVFYFAWGILDGGAMMGRTWSMMRSVPKAYQADGFTLVMIAQAAGAALGALAGGAIFDELTRRTAGGSTLAGLDIRAVYLCLAQLAMLIGYLASRRLVNYDKQTPTKDILKKAWEWVSG